MAEIKPKSKTTRKRKASKRERMLRLGRGLDMVDDYQPSDKFIPAKDLSDPMEVHTISELIECLERNPKVKLEAKVLGYREDEDTREIRRVKLTRSQFLEAIKKNRNRKFKEAVDYFGTDYAGIDSPAVVGSEDFIPLLGGPFNKQLYYADYVRMHARCFHALHHDPVAKAVVHILRDFTLGRDWEFHSSNPTAKAAWEAFCKANNFRKMMDDIAIEISTYGEVFLWFLPDNQVYRTYEVPPEQESPKGILPRIRLVDPSNFWEIVTYPEDMSRVLYYQWVAPTQFEYYTGKDKGQSVPGSKFIYQQIPADEILHYRVNSVSNEKRGRSDLFPVLGYLKRLRDSVNYSIISLQKAAAWSIDTTIEGAQEDIDAYVRDQQELGTIPTAGSEFVHTDKIKRDYLSNSATAKGGGANDAFQWALSMISIGTGIPVQYLGTHISGAGTRASALVATEPVAKKFEMRQNLFRRIILEVAERYFKKMGITPGDMDIVFPDLVIQDRSQKLRDLGTAQANGWVSAETAANIAAKELAIQGYDYSKEQERIDSEGERYTDPLTAPPKLDTEKQPSGIDSQDKRDARIGRGF